MSAKPVRPVALTADGWLACEHVGVLVRHLWFARVYRHDRDEVYQLLAWHVERWRAEQGQTRGRRRSP